MQRGSDQCWRTASHYSGEPLSKNQSENCVHVSKTAILAQFHKRLFDTLVTPVKKLSLHFRNLRIALSDPQFAPIRTVGNCSAHLQSEESPMQ